MGRSEPAIALPDVLAPELKLIFCGTAAGPISAEVGAYYAGRGNRFWDILFRTGLVPRRLDPNEFHTLPNYGLGLTDLAKTSSGPDKDLPSLDFDIVGFCRKVREFSPKIIAFNGKAAASTFFGDAMDYGGPHHDERLGEIAIFVLPSTSAAARRYWNESRWMELADYVRKRC
jgi:TDG/mug DNA glycosylase family protein